MQQDALPSQAARIGRFGGYIVKEAGFRAFLALGFLVLGSLAEGISVLLLIPLLQLLGPESGVVTLRVPTSVVADLLGPEVRLGLVPVLVVLVLLVLAQALFMRFKNIYMAELLYHVINRLRITLFEGIGRARWSFISSIRGSDLSHAMTADIDRIQNAAFHLLLLIQTGVLLSAYLCVSWLISPAMTVFAFVAGGAVLVALHPIRKRASAYGRLLTENRQEQYRTVSEFLAGIKVAKSFNAEPRYLAELAATLERMRREYSHFVRLSSFGGVLFQVSSVLMLATFVYVAITHLRLPVPELVVLVFLFLRLAPRFTELQSHVQETLVNLPAFQNIERMQAACDREQEQLGAPIYRAPLLRREVCFDDVSFRYAGDNTATVLTDVSFILPAREITALIGPSGSGKSTVADMLMGLLEPAAGAVTIDGVKLDDSNRRSWRDHVAYVPQEVFLLHETIAANLRLAAADVDEAAMWKALRGAHADEFVARLPDSLETVVGDRGIRLSGGERQRIALARALLRQPQLLILDEATSALDWESQSLIAHSIQQLRGSMTIVTIAHRLSMIAFADWVVAIEKGRVVESGHYEQLIRTPDSRLARLAAGEQNDGTPPKLGPPH